MFGPPQGMQGANGADGPAGPAGANGSNGADGADGGGSVEVYYSAVAMTAYGTSGFNYTPLAKNATEQYVEFMLTAWKTGDLEVALRYAMSASNSGNVALSVTSLAVGEGEDPNGAPSEDTTFTITPGSNTTMHVVDSSDDSSMAIPVTLGDLVFVRVKRKNVGGDTHTGSLNVIDIRVGIS